MSTTVKKGGAGAVASLVAERRSSDPEVPNCGWSLAYPKFLQESDPDIQSLKILQAEHEQRPGWTVIGHESASVKAPCNQWQFLLIKDGILYREWTPEHAPSKTVLQLVAPRKLQKQIWGELHGGRTSGHLVVTKTLFNVRQRFYWPGYREDIQRWCQRCFLCQQRKIGSKKKRVSLQQDHVGAPMERIAMDFLGPLKPPENGNKYILVVSDYFTKWTEAFALPDQASVS